MSKFILLPKTMFRFLVAMLAMLTLIWAIARLEVTSATTSGSTQGSNFSAGDAVRRETRPTDKELEKRSLERYGDLPLSFEGNSGQFSPKVQYASRGAGYALFLTADESVLVSAPERVQTKRTSKKGMESAVLRLRMAGANPKAVAESQDELPGRSNYFVGNDPTKWRTNVPNYSRVQYRDIYPGVNLIYYGNQRQIEYDFVLAPGADPGVIKLSFRGTRGLRLDPDGDLILETRRGSFRMHKPIIHQMIDGTKKPIEGRFTLLDKRVVGFKIGEYDRSNSLVIDPLLTYSTFLGGSNSEDGRAIAVDSAGNAYVTGRTNSFNFPIVIGSLSTSWGSGNDCFVSKINPAGTALVYSTFLGGMAEDTANGIALDTAGNAYITGSTSSSNFPTTPGALQTVLSGSDAFISKLNTDGSALIYSTYVGGTSTDQSNAIDVDSFGNAYIAGFTTSTNFPTSPGAFQTTNAGGSFPNGDAFVSKLNSTGSALVYSTFIGGSNQDQASGIKVNSLGNAYVTGSTRSSTFPTTVGAFQTTFAGPATSFSGSQGDAFVAEFNDSGTGLVYSTFLGGTSDDAALGIAIDSAGDAYVTGLVNSSNFPTTSDVFRVGNGGLAKSTNDGIGWAAINSGVTSATISALGIDPSVPVIYAATSGGGFFRSTNGGANWAFSSFGLTDSFVRCLAIDPVTPSIIYVGTGSHGVFRSTNGGTTWGGVNNGQNGANVNTVAIDPVSHNIVYAGSDQGLYKTTNSGVSWKSLNLATSIATIAIDPHNSSTVYAAPTFGALFKSTDAGASWTQIAQNFASQTTSLTIDPMITSTIYVSTFNGVAKSTDAGLTWIGSSHGLTNRNVSLLKISPAINSTLYAGTGDGVFKSTDSGGSWTAVNHGLLGEAINALAIDPTDPTVLYAGAGFASSDAFVTELNPAGSGLIFSTLLGGSSTESGAAIALDGSGNVYVTGLTLSANFPITPGLFVVPISSFQAHAFVSKISPQGTSLGFSTGLAGNNSEQGLGIAVDSGGSSYVTGSTFSQNFPVTPGVFQPLIGGSPNNFNGDGFVTKFPPSPNINTDLAVVITSMSQSNTVSESIIYTITVTNNGPDAVGGIIISDDLPPTIVGNSCDSQNALCNRIGNSFTFTLLNQLGPSATAQMRIFGQIGCDAPDGSSISNTASLDIPFTDSDVTNNSATTLFSVINPMTTLSPTSQSFNIDGGFGFISVNRGAGCSWTSVSNDSWISIQFSGNCCNSSVGFNVAPNPGPPRIGTLTIAGKTFTVTQAGTCTYNISTTSKSFAANGGTGTIDVTAPNLCDWIAFSNNPEFVTITNGIGGSGNGTVSYSVAPNTTPFNRMFTLTVAAKTFTVFQGAAFLDVPQDHIFYSEIGKLSARGITLGCGNGNFCPNEPVTREQMAAFIMRARGEPNPLIPVTQRFDDVPPSNPFYPFIDRLAVLQITQGCSVSPPLYCPSSTVPREQMAAFIVRALNELNPPLPANQRFDDVLPANQFYSFIDRMAVLGITSGCSTNPPLFCPDLPVTRGQMAVFLVRAFNL